MNPMLMSMMMVLAVIASCQGGHQGGSAAPGIASTEGALHRVEGPPLDRLSLEQIEGIVHTCFLHHDLDDARIPYTRVYCERVFAERDRRTLSVHAKSVASGALDALH
jgi:hypothetical protein